MLHSNPVNFENRELHSRKPNAGEEHVAKLNTQTWGNIRTKLYHGKHQIKPGFPLQKRHGKRKRDMQIRAMKMS